MKKFFSILLFTSLCLIASAQINRVIWGLTLGKSTKQEVKTALVKKGFKIRQKSNGSISVTSDKISFEDIDWHHVSFSFSKEVFAQVVFSNNEQYASLNPNDCYDKLKSYLDKRYSNYYVDLKTDGSKKSSFYKDNKTSIYLDTSIFEDQTYIGLTYVDLKFSDVQE